MGRDKLSGMLKDICTITVLIVQTGESFSTKRTSQKLSDEGFIDSHRSLVQISS